MKIGFVSRGRFGGVVSSSAAPYTWYPSLDKNTIPFHAGAGDWGPQYTIQEAAAPVTTTSVTVTTWTEFRDQCLLGSRVITIGADINGALAFINGGITDVDIVIPAGRVLRSFAFGQSGAGHINTRVRLRSSVAGTLGGQLHNVTFYARANDTIIADLDLTGPGNVLVNGVWRQQTALDFNAHGGTFDNAGSRIAITRCRIMSGNENYLAPGVRDLIVTGCSCVSGAEANRPGGLEAWNFRQSCAPAGAYIWYDNDMRGSQAPSYHRIRIHPNGDDAYAYVANNRFVDFLSARILTVDAGLVSNPKGYLRGFWAVNNETWSTEPNPGDDFSCHGAAYARMSNNTFYSDVQNSDAKILVNDSDNGTPAIPDGIQDWLISGNVYNALQDHPGGPAWKSTTPGNPTGLTWNLGA